MRKEQKEIDALGPIGIIREAFKLLWTYSKFFMAIQLTLMLPLVVLMTAATEYVIYWSLSDQTPPPPGTARVPHVPTTFSVSLHAPGAPGLNLGLAVAVSLLFWAAVAIIGVALTGVSLSAIIYAVGLHYTGQRISFRGVLDAAIPRLWMRLTVTNAYKVFLIYVILIGQGVSSVLLLQFHSALPLELLGVAALGVMSIIGMAVVQVIFMLAAGVSVLEKDYGWAAVRRTPKLLKGRVIVALFFELLLLVPTISLLGFQRAMRYQISQWDYSGWSVAVFVFTTVVYISLTSFFGQMSALCAGVKYVSFKAYHNEDLADCIFEKEAVKEGYERIGSLSDGAKLGGQKGDSFV